MNKRAPSRAKKLICPVLLLIVLLCIGVAYFLVSKIPDSAQLAREAHTQAMYDKMKKISWGDSSLPVTLSYPKLEYMQELLENESLTIKRFDFREGGMI